MEEGPRAKPLRAAIVTRVSSERQAREGQSLADQRERAERWCAREGARIVGHYVDDGVSGATIWDRPAIRSLVADVEAAKIDVAVFAYVDRIGRTWDVMPFLRWLRDRGVRVVVTEQPIDFETPEGELMGGITAGFAAYWLANHRKRVRDAMGRLQAEGRYTGGPPPLGFRVEAKRLLVDESEADQVRALFDAYLREGSLVAACAWARARGLRTKRRVPGPWRPSALRRLLTNPRYIAQASRDVDAPGAWKPLVPQDVWDAVQHRLRTNTRGGLGAAPVHHPLGLRGRVRCLLCDRPMGTSHATRGGRRLPYYRCLRPPGAPACPLGYVPALGLERAAAARIADLTLDPGLLDETVVRATEIRARALRTFEAERKSLRTEAARLEAAMEGLWRAIESGVALERTIGGRLDAHQARLAEVQALLAANEAAFEAERAAIFDPDAVRRRLRSLRVSADVCPRRRAELLAALVDRIDLSPDGAVLWIVPLAALTADAKTAAPKGRRRSQFVHGGGPSTTSCEPSISLSAPWVRRGGRWTFEVAA